MDLFYFNFCSENDDYIGTTDTVLLSDNDSQTVNVSLVDNRRVEGNQSFEGQLMTSRLYPNLHLIEKVTVTIIDNGNCTVAVIHAHFLHENLESYSCPQSMAKDPGPTDNIVSTQF